MIVRLMTKSEYAHHRGVSTQYISKLIKQKKISVEYGDKIDPEKVDAILGPVSPEKKSSLPTPTSNLSLLPKSEPTAISTAEGIEISAEKILASTSLFEAQRYKEIFQALTKKLEYEKLDGSLLSREEVEKAAFESGRQIRDMLQAIPDRIAPLVAAETDLHACTQILKAEIRSILESMCDVVTRG